MSRMFGTSLGEMSGIEIENSKRQKEMSRLLLDDKQTEALRNMTPAEKWKASMSLYWSARSLKTAFLKREHPEWTDQMIQDQVNLLFSEGHD